MTTNFPAQPAIHSAGRPAGVVTFDHVSKVYGANPGNPAVGVRALNEVSVQIAPAQFTAIMGPSGSGKSTFMNIAAGLDTPSDGRVWIADREITHLDDNQLTLLRREMIGFIFQSFNLVPTLTAQENVLLPFQLAGRSPSAEQHGWIDYLMHTLGLADRASHTPSQLSGGQQQRVAIARALASRPAVIFADEPTGNLDTRSSREVLALLRTAASEYGQSIAMVTHDPVAASYADRVLVIADGRLVGDYGQLDARQISNLLIHLEDGAA